MNEDIIYAIRDVEQSFLQLEFSVKMMVYANRGFIDLEKFDTDLLILEQENDFLYQPYFKDKDLIILASQINVASALGISAIILNDAFVQAKIENKPDSNLEDDQIRTFVYMVRCAFAHNFAKPTWKIKKCNQKRYIFNFKNSKLDINLSELDGKEFDYKQIGGLTLWHNIKNRSVDIIKNKKNIL